MEREERRKEGEDTGKEESIGEMWKDLHMEME